jgi:hypothetical protein
MTALRVAFLGSSGTGKTRLAMWISRTYGLVINPVGSRSVSRDMGFDNPYDVDDAGKREEFQQRLFASKRCWESDHENFVTDRTTLDNLAYATMHGMATSITREQLDAYVAALDRYTHIIYLPLDRFQNLGDDPVRISNPGYHVLFDRFVHAWMVTFGPLGKLYVMGCPLEMRQAELEGILGSAMLR